jgi:hypothetical protein
MSHRKPGIGVFCLSVFCVVITAAAALVLLSPTLLKGMVELVVAHPNLTVWVGWASVLLVFVALPLTFYGRRRNGPFTPRGHPPAGPPIYHRIFPPSGGFVGRLPQHLHERIFPTGSPQASAARSGPGLLQSGRRGGFALPDDPRVRAVALIAPTSALFFGASAYLAFAPSVHIPAPERWWVALAVGACGLLTLVVIGAVSSPMVMAQARTRGGHSSDHHA